jgi:hypothetical protein
LFLTCLSGAGARACLCPGLRIERPASVPSAHKVCNRAHVKLRQWPRGLTCIVVKSTAQQLQDRGEFYRTLSLNCHDSQLQVVLPDLGDEFAREAEVEAAVEVLQSLEGSSR